MNELLQRFFTWLIGRPRVIGNWMFGLQQYIVRWYLRGMPRMPDGSWPFEEDGAVRQGAISPDGHDLYVHRIRSSDDEVELHNHPWSWAIALVFWGGYLEERWSHRLGRVVRRRVWPGTINVIRGSDLHRIDLLFGDSWSLFLCGPKHDRSWGFWNRETGSYQHWRSFIAEKRKHYRREPA